MGRVRTVERSEPGGESYIKASEKLWRNCFGSADERRCGTNRENKGSRGSPGGLRR